MAHRVAGFAVDFLICAFDSIQVHDVACAGGALSGDKHPLLIVSSTFGTGELPRSAHPFREAIENDELIVRDTAYGIICLGDRSFRASFCGAGRQWYGLLSRSGGNFKGPILNLDMCLRQIDVPAIHRWSQAWIASMSEA